MLSEEHKRKISEAMKGKKQSSETIAKRIEKIKGQKRSEETRTKISLAKKGIKFTEEHRKNIGKARIGRKLTDETKRKLSEIRTGKKLNRTKRGYTRSSEEIKAMSIGMIESEKFAIARRGEKNPQSKLTEDDVRQIRLLLGQGVSQRSLARMFSVDRKVIHNILHQKSWVHVE
ncbi:NUMOD3 domain-containing DNA-binding protein [Brevibacillus agri]|uniref:NUMOD3 domain-containing DNA-binding protein n=1 Tax=Brevibacillus agri TaxID=51101 RepID=UPI0018CE1493|nr:NUMOD3 domain-containing DNA-binding protein [Brevibacillus agri]MBG9564892.1 hypothetical protein [Brevibacillus agri]